MCVKIIKDKNDSRLMGIRIKRGDTTYHILNVYLPTESADNLTDFTHYLYKIHTLFQNNDTVYNMAVGYFNANLLKQSIFCSGLIKFCHENDYVLGDQGKLPGQTFTFHSDAHDTVSWLDHALCSMSMYQTIDHMSVLYQYLTSDHFPLSLYLNVPYTAVSNYMHTTDVLLKDLVLADDVITCSGGHCTNQGHVDILSNTYGHIINCLKKLMKYAFPRNTKNVLLLFQVGINICQSLMMNPDKHIFFGVVTINLDRVLFMKL